MFPTRGIQGPCRCQHSSSTLGFSRGNGRSGCPIKDLVPGGVWEQHGSHGTSEMVRRAMAIYGNCGIFGNVNTIYAMKKNIYIYIHMHTHCIYICKHIYTYKDISNRFWFSFSCCFGSLHCGARPKPKLCQVQRAGWGCSQRSCGWTGKCYAGAVNGIGRVWVDFSRANNGGTIELEFVPHANVSVYRV